MWILVFKFLCHKFEKEKKLKKKERKESLKQILVYEYNTMTVQTQSLDEIEILTNKNK